MKSNDIIIFLSDCRLGLRLNLMKPLEKYNNLKRVLIIEENYKTHGDIPNNWYDEVILVKDILKVNDYESVVYNLMQTGTIKAIIAPSENVISIGGYLRTKFGISGMQQNQAEAVRNKWIMKEMVRQCGIKTCKFSIAVSKDELKRFANDAGYPIIVKPISGLASKNTFKLSSENELNQYLDNEWLTGSTVLIEEFITGLEFHCDSVVHNGEVIFSSVGEYLNNCIDIAMNNKPAGSITYPARDDIMETIKKIKEMNSSVIKALGIRNAVCHAEMFLDSSGNVYFGEIGARIGGADVMPPCIMNTHGVDLFSIYMDIELQTFELVKTNYTSNYTGMICFPSREGIIDSISSESDFLNIEGLVDIQITYKKGQLVKDINDTSTRAGFAIIEDKDFNKLKEKLLLAYTRFHITTETYTPYEFMGK